MTENNHKNNRKNLRPNLYVFTTRKILKIADNIESERKTLKQVNSTLETQLFQLLNKFVRHDYSQTPYILSMDKKYIE